MKRLTPDPGTGEILPEDRFEISGHEALLLVEAYAALNVGLCYFHSLQKGDFGMHPKGTREAMESVVDKHMLEACRYVDAVTDEDLKPEDLPPIK